MPFKNRNRVVEQVTFLRQHINKRLIRGKEHIVGCAVSDLSSETAGRAPYKRQSGEVTPSHVSLESAVVIESADTLP